eukprot:COSAG05_NODE_9567_length_615_cov_1.288760_2_plen_38_part_01
MVKYRRILEVTRPGLLQHAASKVDKLERRRAQADVAGA